MRLPNSNSQFSKWYLYLLAAFYGFTCGLWFFYYVYQDLTEGGAYIPWRTQITCLIGALSAILYFVRPKIGHHGLILTTLVALSSAIMDPNVVAIVFHAVVLAILCVPLLSILRRR